jgi:choline dehydrogenase-like flavoprotein
MFNTNAQAPLRGAPTPDKPFGFYDATAGGGWEVPGEPYTVARGSEPFKWWRPRMLGGRTNHWGRVALRFGPLDFKPRARDGLGYDWPIDYDDLAPWYDKVERLIGVTGRAEGLENTPDSPDGCLLPPPPPRPHEYFLARGFESMGIPVAAIHAAVLTRPLNGRSACMYATSCLRGCAIRANFQSTTVLLPPALASGKLEIRTNALVYQVDLDRSGRAKGVSYIDRRTGEHHCAAARAVVLAAGAAESARILLNSKSATFPDGLNNDHGMVGRYLMDSVGAYAAGVFPALSGLPRSNDDGISLGHIYVPWWGYEKQRRKELPFPRGYHVEFDGGRTMPTLTLDGLLDLEGESSDLSRGEALRAEVRGLYGTNIGCQGRGEMIPNEHSYCDLDPHVKDRWGVPVLRFHWRWSDHEINQVSHMMETFLEVIDRLGGKPMPWVQKQGKKAIAAGGSVIHEVGTLRMGASPRDSAVNAFGQTWAVDNLFVADGAVMASSPDKNPTLSILALSWRTSSHLAERARRGDL